MKLASSLTLICPILYANFMGVFHRNHQTISERMCGKKFTIQYSQLAQEKQRLSSYCGQV